MKLGIGEGRVRGVKRRGGEASEERGSVKREEVMGLGGLR